MPCVILTAWLCICEPQWVRMLSFVIRNYFWGRWNGSIHLPEEHWLPKGSYNQWDHCFHTPRTAGMICFHAHIKLFLYSLSSISTMKMYFTVCYVTEKSPYDMMLVFCRDELQRFITLTERSSWLQDNQHRVQSPASVMEWGVLAPMIGVTCTFVKAPGIQKGRKEF